MYHHVFDAFGSENVVGTTSSDFEWEEIFQERGPAADSKCIYLRAGKLARTRLSTNIPSDQSSILPRTRCWMITTFSQETALTVVEQKVGSAIPYEST